MSLIPSGELKDNSSGLFSIGVPVSINESNSLRGVERRGAKKPRSGLRMVSMSLIPSGELKVHLVSLLDNECFSINESNSLRGVESVF